MKILSNKKYRELVARTQICLPANQVDLCLEKCYRLLESTEANLNKKWSREFTRFLLEYRQTLLTQIEALENMKKVSKE